MSANHNVPIVQDFEHVDMVVEAASEREDMKHGIFAALDQVLH